jgi:hypothetical protein
MNDRYFSTAQSIKRLMSQYKEHGKLIIAFDFDDTVFDYRQKGDTFHKIHRLLREAKKRGYTLILFTCREGMAQVLASKWCFSNGFGPDYLNDSPVGNGGTKPYYNLLLDDKAGLRQASFILEQFLEQTHED